MSSVQEELDMAIVYRHRRLDTNEIFYVGIGKKESRAYQKRSRNQFWKNIIDKTNYEVEIIARDLSYNDACELEILLIREYGRRDLGLGNLVNLTDGRKLNINISLISKVANNKPLYKTAGGYIFKFKKDE
jgi:hypothetical protein